MVAGLQGSNVTRKSAVMRRKRSLALRRLLQPLNRLFGNYLFSSLTRRILFLNLAGLAVLLSGIMYLNQFRDGLIDARVESLMTQGEIIAAARSRAGGMFTTNSTVMAIDRQGPETKCIQSAQLPAAVMRKSQRVTRVLICATFCTQFVRHKHGRI